MRIHYAIWPYMKRPIVQVNSQSLKAFKFAWRKVSQSSIVNGCAFGHEILKHCTLIEGILERLMKTSKVMKVNSSFQL